jgi:hypothetical protein
LRIFTGIALVPLRNTIIERPEKYRFLRRRLGGEIGTVPERRISWSGGEKTDETKKKPKISYVRHIKKGLILSENDPPKTVIRLKQMQACCCRTADDVPVPVHVPTYGR